MFKVPSFFPCTFLFDVPPTQKRFHFKWIRFAVILFLGFIPAPAQAAFQFVEAQYGGPILDEVTGLAGSPDGRHLYAAGYWNGVIAVYTRDSATGQLALTQTQRDGAGGVDGLDSAMDIAVSADGQSLYVVGDWDDGLAVFSRDSDTGELTFIEVHKEGDTVDGLDGAVDVVVSPDNRHVYVASYVDDSVAIFSRDTTTGALTYAGIVQDEIDGVEGIYGAFHISISPDGGHLYVVGYFGTLTVFARSSVTGELTFIESHTNGLNGVDGIDGASGAVISTDGNHLYVAGTDDDAVALFNRDSTTGRLTFVQAFFNETNGISGLVGPMKIALSPDGSRLMVSGWYGDSLVVFSRHTDTGTLTFLQTLTDDTDGVDGLLGAFSLVVSPDDAHVYVAGEYDNGVGIFAWNSALQQLDFVHMQQDRYADADGLYGVVGVTVSPDGRHVYSAAGLWDNSIAVFGRDSATGALTFIESLTDGEDGVDGLFMANAVAVSPDGNHLYAAGYGDDAVALFDRDSTTGQLNYVQAYKDGNDSIDGLDGALAIAITANGTHVYIAGYRDNAVAVFGRNTDTGALTFVEMQQDGAGGVDGLGGVRAVTLSPDEKQLYTAARSDSAVAVFNRDTDTGRLTFLEMQKDGVGGVDGLYGAMAVTLSTDGSALYAAGRYDDAVAVFSRDADTGQLTFLDMQKDGTNGVDGVNGACDLVVAPLGDHLYAAGFFDNAITAFGRDTDTGRLTFAQMHKDGTGGVDGLNGISALAVSPDGYHLYAAGEYDSAVAVFSLDSDNDGQVNANDPFPLDPTETDDTDGDGIGNNADSDDDNDGISDVVEDAGPNSGDGNDDGILDSRQDNVATFTTVEDPTYVTLATPSGTSLSGCQATGTPSPADAPSNVAFAYGFFSFTLTGVEPGGSTSLTLYLPTDANVNTYYKYGPTPAGTDDHWYTFAYDGTTGAQINQNIITLHFVDGGRGDDDLDANGLIVDIGGPGWESIESTPDANSAGGSDDGDGGCFVTTAWAGQ